MPIIARKLTDFVRHDWWIANNLIRAAFARWSDRLTLALGLPILLMLGHSWFAGLPKNTSALIIQAGSFAIAFSLSRGVMARLEYHRTVGVLAIDALQSSLAFKYVLSLVGCGLLGAATTVSAMDMRAFPLCLASLLAGAICGSIAGYAGSGFGAAKPIHNFSLTIGMSLKSPVAAIALAAALGAVSLPVTMAYTHMAAMATQGLAGLAFSLALSRVDHAAIRFMAQSGYSPSRTVFIQTRALAAFVGLGALVGYTLLGSPGAAMLLAIGTIVLLISVVRILAFRIYSKRVAEWVVALFLGAIAVTTYTFPLMLPLAAGMAVWWLWRAARLTTWQVSS